MSTTTRRILGACITVLIVLYSIIAQAQLNLLRQVLSEAVT